MINFGFTVINGDYVLSRVVKTLKYDHACKDRLAVISQSGSNLSILFHLLTRNVLDCDQSNYSPRITFSYTFTLEPNTIGSGESFQRYDHSKLYKKTANGRDLEFGPTGSRDIRSAYL